MLERSLRGMCTLAVATAITWMAAPDRPPWQVDLPALDAEEPPAEDEPEPIRIAQIEAIPEPDPEPEIEPIEAVSEPPEPEAAATPAPEPIPPTLQEEPAEPEVPEPEPDVAADDAPEPAAPEPPPLPEDTALAEPEPTRPEPEAPARDPEPLAAEPAPEPEPDVAEAAPPARPEPEPVDDVSLAIGRHRLEEGRYPHQRASYARIGFEAYRDAMLALGGAFFIYDVRNGRVLAEVDPHSFALRPMSAPPADLSRWPRDVTRYLGEALEQPETRSRFGKRATRVVLLPPAKLDAAFVGGLDRALRKRGMNIERVTQVRLIYELTEAGLECEVSRIGLRDGSEQPVSLRLALSGPIPASADGGRS